MFTLSSKGIITIILYITNAFYVHWYNYYCSPSRVQPKVALFKFRLQQERKKHSAQTSEVSVKFFYEAPVWIKSIEHLSV